MHFINVKMQENSQIFYLKFMIFLNGNDAPFSFKEENKG